MRMENSIPADDAYLRFHRKRYHVLLAFVEQLLPRHSGVVLDVGPSFQTGLLRERLPDSTVNTLGYEDARFPPRPHEQHIPFDLNNAPWPERWPEVPASNLILFAEVIEHLPTAPQLVLKCLAHWLQPGGHLVLQTPNAASLEKRLKLLAGHNPFEMIRETPWDPGHFREYTVAELLAVGEAAGLVPVNWQVQNYFSGRHPLAQVYNLVCGCLPGRLRDGITMLFRRPL